MVNKRILIYFITNISTVQKKTGNILYTMRCDERKILIFTNIFKFSRAQSLKKKVGT